MSDWSQVDFSRFKVRIEGSERARKKREDELERERIRASGALPPALQTSWNPEAGKPVLDVDWSVALTKAKSVADSFLNRVGQTAINVGPVGAARTLEILKPKPPSRFAGMSPRESPSLAAQRAREQQAGVTPPPEWMDNAIGVLDAYAQESRERLPKPDPRLEGDFWWDQVPQGAASVATMIGAGGIGALFRASPVVIGAVTSALDEAGSTYAQATARLDAKVARGEITPAEAERRGSLAWVGGLPIGAADMLPVAHIFERSNKVLGGALGRVARKMGLGGPIFEAGLHTAAGGLEEAGTEMLQGLGENALQGLVTDDEIEWLKGVKEQGEVGGIVGAGLAAMLGAAKVLRARELAQEAQGVPRGTEGAPTEQAPALPQAAVQAPGELGAPEPGPAPRYGPDLVPGVGVPGVERVGQAAQVEIPPEVRAAAQQDPTVQRFVQNLATVGEHRGRPLSPEQASELLLSATPLRGVAGDLARAFGAQAFSVGRKGVPLELEGQYLPETRTVVLDASLDEKTAARQVIAHELWGHHGRAIAESEWTSIRDQLEADFPDLMDQWRVEQEGIQKSAGVQTSPDLVREESVAQAAEEAAGFTVWALSNRSRLETLLTQARKGDRPTFMQRLLDLFRKAFHAVGIGQGTAQQQLDLLARTVSAGQWESMNPRQAAELAGRFVKLADAMVAAATKPAAQVAPAEVSAPVAQDSSAGRLAAFESEKAASDARVAQIAAEPDLTELRSPSEQEIEARGGFQQEGVAQMPTEPGLFGPMEKESKAPGDQGGPAATQLNLLDVQEGDLPGQTSILDEPKGRPGNPFREKATRARELADRLSKPTAHEAGMAQAFPLGAGFGRGSERSRNRKMDASVARATKAVEAEKNARYLEAQADAFDRGEINAQGRRQTKESQERSRKAADARKSREERIAEAKARIEDKERSEISPEDWATAAGQLGGGGRKLLMSEQAEFVEQHKPAPIPESIQAVAETMKRRRSTKALRFLDALRTITGLPAEADIQLEQVSVADLRKAIYTADPTGPRSRSGVDLRRRASEFLQRAYLDTADALEAKQPTEQERKQTSAQRSKAASERLQSRRTRVAEGLEGDFRAFVRAHGGLANPEGHFDAYTSKEQGKRGGLFGGSPIAFPKGTQKGTSYEEIRDAAVEVGYFPGVGMADVGLQDILDALDSNPVAPGKLGEQADAEAQRHYESELAAEQAYYDALSPEERAQADAFMAERARQAEEGIPFEDRFSPAKGDPVDPRGGPWFSAVRRVVEKMPQPKMQGDAARAWIGKQAGVTAEELDYLGLNELLAGKPSVTQQELLDHIDAHQVRVEETEKSQELVAQGYGGSSTQYARYTLPGGENYRELLLTWNPPSAKLTPEQIAHNERRAAAIEPEWAPLREAHEKVSQRIVEVEHQQIRDDELPEPEIVEVRESPLDEVKLLIPDGGGLIGRTYRVPGSNDWVVQTASGIPQGTLQNKQHAIDLAATNWTQSQRRNFVRRERLRQVYGERRRIEQEMDAILAKHPPPAEVAKQPEYRSSHWSTPNVLAHLRTKDRVTAQGEPTLFVEEVQSDWHQAGRDSGYSSPEAAAAADRALQAANDIWPAFRDALRRNDLLGFDDLQQAEHAIEQHEDFRERWDVEQADVPIMERARALMLEHRRANRDATSRVPDAPFKDTWVSLSLKRAIKWAVDHGRSVIAWSDAEVHADRWNEELHRNIRSLRWTTFERGPPFTVSAHTFVPMVNVSAVNHEDEEVWRGAFDVKTGRREGGGEKDVLAKYIGKENARRILEGAGKGENGDLSGLDLSIGANLFRYIYDDALPQAANKLGKRYGAKVERGQVVTAYALPVAGGNRHAEAHVFRIPPAMAETVRAEGFSTFADKFSPRADEEPAIGPHALGGSFAEREETFWQRLNRRVMYEFAPVARAQKGVLAEGGTVTPESDVAQKQTLYESKRAEDVRAIRQEQRKLVRLLKRAGIKLDEFDDYLRALHAPRRNDLMAERHPGAFDPLYNPGSGSTARGARLTPNVIRDILSTVEADPRAAAFKQGAALVHAVNAAALQQRVDRGILSREGAETWREQFGPEYVPLRSVEMESADGLPFVQGSGFQVPKRLSKRAEGRRTASGSPTVWSFAQAEEVASWARRNEVGLAMAQLVRANPIEGLWRVSDTPTTENGKPVEASDGKAAAFRFKERGDDRYIVFEGATGVQLAETMKRLGVEKTGSLVKYLGGVGRIFTRLATQWNPEFLLRNLVKDVPTALVRTVAVQGWKAGARTGASIPMAIRGIRQVLQAESAGKEPPHGYWQDRFVEFRRAGGKTGYTSLQDYQSRAEDFGKALERGNAAELARFVWSSYENLQEAVEAGTRLAVYDTSIRHGMSEADAAVQARQVTVDFNRKGELTPVLNSLYWFFNPSVQGSRMVLKTLGTPNGAALGAGIAALGYLLAHFNRWIGQDDDDKRNRWDETSDWIKNGYLQVLLPGMVEVPMPGGRKLSIDRVMAPLPWGYNMLFSAGLHAAETQARAEDPAAAMGHVLAAAAESFNPMGASPTPAQFVSPSLIDPFVQLTENRSFTGSLIRPENPFGQKSPSEVYWPDVNEQARELTHWLNQATGGNKREPGDISISPENLEHLVQSYTGGGGQFLERAFKAAQNLVAGEDVGVREVPFVRSFASAPDERAMQSQYRRAINRVRTTDQVQRLDQGAPQRPELLELVEIAKEYEKEIDSLEEAGLAEQANARRREFLKLYRSTLNPEPVR